jgi:hypothetical protein
LSGSGQDAHLATTWNGEAPAEPEHREVTTSPQLAADPAALDYPNSVATAPVEELEALRIEISSTRDNVSARLESLSQDVATGQKEAGEEVQALRHDLSSSQQQLIERIQAIAGFLSEAISVWTETARLQRQREADLRSLVEELRARTRSPASSGR